MTIEQLAGITGATMIGISGFQFIIWVYKRNEDLALFALMFMLFVWFMCLATITDLGGWTH